MSVPMISEDGKASAMSMAQMLKVRDKASVRSSLNFSSQEWFVDRNA
jgi:hypothetical protein